MSGLMRGLTAAVVAVSLCSVSTAAISASPAPPVAVAPASAVTPNAWLTLSAMTSSSSAATAAADDYNDGVGFPPWPVLAVILATIAVGIYILVKDDNDDLDIDFNPEPVSPA
jgi:hypothetical protein